MSKCPYCNMEVSESAIEVEDGCCPECGAMISAPDLVMGDEDSDEDAAECTEDLIARAAITGGFYRLLSEKLLLLEEKSET